jgi:hypothetical protein
MCGKKCFVKYNDGDLAVGEMVCIDRCVGKYMQAQEKVGQVLNSFEQQMKVYIYIHIHIYIHLHIYIYIYIHICIYTCV